MEKPMSNYNSRLEADWLDSEGVMGEYFLDEDEGPCVLFTHPNGYQCIFPLGRDETKFMIDEMKRHVPVEKQIKLRN